TLLFGEAADCDVHVRDVVLDDLARPSFRVDTPWGSVDVCLAVSGRHMAVNAAAAGASVGAVGGDLAAGAAVPSQAGLAAMRMEIERTASGSVILSASYSANRTSMRAAIDALVALAATRRVAIVGLMAEISNPEEEHRAIAVYAAGRGVELIAVGTELYG